MNSYIKNYLWEAAVLALFLAVAAGFWYVNAFSKSVTPSRTFSVNGEGKVIAVPDVAELSFGVLTEGGKNLADLQKENTGKVNRVIAFLKESKIDDKNIKTQFYNITPRYQYFSCPPREKGEVVSCPPSEIVGYSIHQSVLVKIRDLNEAGDIVAGVVENGANSVSGPNFTVDDPTEFQNKAREEAILKAKEKAKSVAKAGGFRIGKIVSINEGVFLPQPLAVEKLAAFGKGGDLGGAPEIEPGSQEIKVNVTLSYEIK